MYFILYYCLYHFPYGCRPYPYSTVMFFSTCRISLYYRIILFDSHVVVRTYKIKTHWQISGKCRFQPNLILALEQSWNTTQSGLKTKLFYLCHLFSLMKACDTADKYLNAFWSIQISFNIFNFWHLVSCPLSKIIWEQKLFRRRTFQRLHLPNFACS